MKQAALALSFLSASGVLCAASCGQLQVTITNNTGSTCKLQSVNYNYGMPIQSTPSAVIENGSTSSPLVMQQDVNGVNLVLHYNCNNKKVVIESIQDSCEFTAGKIKGYSDISNNLSSIYQVATGSLWAGRPGKIDWVFSDLS